MSLQDWLTQIGVTASWAPWALMALVGALLGALIVWLILSRKIQRLHADKVSLQSDLAAEARVQQERERAFKEARQQLADSFSKLSSQALKDNNDVFMRLAGERLKRQQGEAEAVLKAREHAIENMIKPVHKALEKTESQIRSIEKERKEAYGAINRYLETMSDSQRELRQETANLVKALRRPEVRGRWGELSLRRLVELAGMVDHCDFVEQQSQSDGESVSRPDMIVQLPDDRQIIVDAKTPLDAYLSAIEAESDGERSEQLLRHARKIKERIRELSAKAYWSQFKRSPDYVVLFIPGDQFLSAALDQDHGLIEDAIRNKVLLATPTSLIALLRAIAYGWRQVALARHAEEVQDLGNELHSRLGTFLEHLSKLGGTLNSTVNHFNKAMGSLSRNVLPQARRMEDLGIESKKELPDIDLIEQQAREE